MLVAAAVGVGGLFIYWGIAATSGEASVDLPSILLSAAALFILIFSVLVGLGAAFGWRGLRDLTAHQVRQRVEEDIEKLSLNHRMHVNVTRAFIYQRMSYRKFKPGMKETIRLVDKKLITQAIDTLDTVLGEMPEDHEKIDKVTNNLAFLLAIRKERKDAERAWNLVRKLREEHLPGWTFHPAINTYACVATRYRDELDIDHNELSRIAKELRWVLEDENASQRDHEDARRHLQEVRRAIQSL